MTIASKMSERALVALRARHKRDEGEINTEELSAIYESAVVHIHDIYISGIRDEEIRIERLRKSIKGRLLLWMSKYITLLIKRL